MYGFKFLLALVVIAMAFASSKKTETKTAPKGSSSSKAVTMKSAKGSSLTTMDEDALAFIQVRFLIVFLRHLLSKLLHSDILVTINEHYEKKLLPFNYLPFILTYLHVCNKYIPWQT